MYLYSGHNLITWSLFQSHSADCCGEYWCHWEKATHLTLSSSNIVHHQILSTMKYSPPSNVIMRRYKIYLMHIPIKNTIARLDEQKPSDSNLEIVTVLAIMQFLWLFCLYTRSVCLNCIYYIEITVLNIVFICMISP